MRLALLRVSSSCALALLAACAARSGYERANATAERTETYRADVVRLGAQVGLATESLRALTVNPGDSPRSNHETFQTFQRELSDLEALVERSRRTYTRMHERAALFFGGWSEDSAAIGDADLKQSAEQRRTALAASYDKLGESHQAAELALQRFTAQLRDLGVYLEHDLTAAGMRLAAGPIQKAFAESARLQEQLGALAHASAQAEAALAPLQDLAPSQQTRAAREALVN